MTEFLRPLLYQAKSLLSKADLISEQWHPGAILLEFKLPGTEPCSKQMVYVTPNVSRLFLSREACSELGIIPRGFPSTVVGATSSIMLPERHLASARPAHNHYRYQRTIFKASTFNTCCHQPLPMMAGPT